jgi:Uma2 family endonuclease
MTAVTQRLTVEEFDQWVELPENADRLFEYIGGEIVEVPSNPYASYIAGRVFRHVANFVEDNDLGYATGEAGGYMVFGERYAPDVAFISKERQPQLAQEGYNPNPPDLAVEIDFPSTHKSQHDLTIKVGNYLSAGTVVWLVYPETQRVEMYTPGQPVKILDAKGVLDGGAVLPGFQLAVKDIFPPAEPDK